MQREIIEKCIELLKITTEQGVSSTAADKIVTATTEIMTIINKNNHELVN